MPISATPFAAKKFADINGRRMAYIDEGTGPAIVFQHGNPTSSYLWRNIMPHCAGLGRLVACDLIGMGDSDKLAPSGPDRYGYAEQRDYLFALWDSLALGDRIVLVIHDWGSALGFEWARRNPERVAGIVYMEAIVAPLTWADWPERARGAFQGFRADGGEDMILAKNMFVERILPGSILRKLADEEMAEYRRPFAKPGEDRRPTLSWPRQIPIEGAARRRRGRGGGLLALARRQRHPQAVHQRRPRLHPGRPPARALPQLAQPDRGHRQRPALHPGGQPRRDRPGGRRFRAQGARLRGASPPPAGRTRLRSPNRNVMPAEAGTRER